MGFENSEDIHCQNSALIITNGIRKVRLGVDILTKEFLILVSTSRTQCFRIRPCLQQSFPCINNAQPIRILLSMFLFSLFLARGKGKRVREKLLLVSSFILFFFYK